MMARLPLGSPPDSGAASLCQARKFKELMRETLGTTKGLSLVTVRGENGMWVEAVYTEGDGAAEVLAREAAGAAADVWADVARLSHRALVR